MNDKEDLRLPIVLRKLWYKLDRKFQSKIGKTVEITTDQYSVLRTVIESTSNHQSINQKGIADKLGLHQNTITQICKTLNKKKYIERIKEEFDKRSYRITLTAKGVQIYNSIYPIAERLRSDLLETIPKEKRLHFLENLHILSEKIDKI
jgi:MarR family transcriptional regulator, transcriptional regulator for hemolysin